VWAQALKADAKTQAQLLSRISADSTHHSREVELFLARTLASQRSQEVALACDMIAHGAPVTRGGHTLLMQLVQKNIDSNLSYKAARALAACKLSDSEAIEKLKSLLAVADPGSREKALIALSGKHRVPKDVSQMLVKHLSADTSTAVRQTAAALLGERSDWPDDASVKKALIKACLSDRSSEVRKIAVLSLAATGEPSKEVCEAFGKGLLDPSEDVVLYTLTAIGTVGGEAASCVDAVLKQTKSSSSEVRTRAISTLVRMGLAAAPGLGKMLLEGDEEAVEQAAEALAQIDAQARRRCLPELVTGLSSKREVVRLHTLGAIMELESDASVYASHILNVLKSDPSDRVRWTAAFAFYRMGHVGRRYADEVLKIVRGDSSYRVRSTVAAWIGQSIGSIQCELDWLIAGVREDESPVVRASCARSLGDIGVDSDKVIEALRVAAKDKDERVRRDAAKALTHLSTGPKQSK
jgi:HEAT repeat protein